LIENRSRTGGLEGAAYAQERFRIDDYRCEYDIAELENFVNLCDDFPAVQDELFKWRMFGRRCAACRMVRLNDFDNAEHWLERARRELAEKKDILDRRDDHFNNLGYLSFIAGTLDFKKYFHTGEPLAKPLFPGIKTESDGARIRIGARTPFYFASSSGKTELLHSAVRQLQEAARRFRDARVEDSFAPLVLIRYMLYTVAGALNPSSLEQRTQVRDRLIRDLERVGNFCVIDPREAIATLEQNPIILYRPDNRRI